MGLDTSHNAWHGPYLSFNRFRRNLMFVYNSTELDHYDGYGGDSLSLENIEDKGLYIFFNHSDCDGDISPENCKLVYESLMQLRDKITDEGILEYLIQFADGCKLAFDQNETLEFH